jgi:excisionase family DNA binding protein
MKVTFDSLPEAVSELFNKLHNIETLLTQKGTAQPAPEGEELLSVKEAAVFLRLKVPTVYGLISKGQIPVLKPGKHCYFSKSDLLHYINEGRKQSRAEIESDAHLMLKQKGK